MTTKSNADIVDSVLPLYRMSKVVGLAPYTINKKNGITSFEVTWKDVLFSILMISVFLYVNPTAELGLDDPIKTSREFDLIIYGVKLYFPILVDLLGGLTILFHRNKFEEFFTSMLQIDARFKENNIEIDHKKMRKNTYISLFVNLLCIFMLYIIKRIGALLEYGLQPVSLYFWDLIVELHAFVYLSLIMQIWIGLINLSHRYHLINGTLRAYIKVDRIQLANVNIHSEITVNQHEKSFRVNRGDVVNSIHNLCSIHNDLQSAAKIFNNIYSLVLLLIITNIFVGIVSRLYLLLPGTDTIWSATKIIANILYYNGLNFYIIRAAHLITQEVINNRDRFEYTIPAGVFPDLSK